MMSVKDWYDREKQKIRDTMIENMQILDSLLSHKQMQCNHEFERHDSLMYALGETYPGMYCPKCDYSRHLTDDEKYPKKPKKFFGLLSILLLAFVCGCSEPTTKEVVYKDIDRVFMHSWNRVSFFKQNEDGSITHKFLYSYGYGKIKYLADVPKDEKMWAKETIIEGSMDKEIHVEIHLHSVDEVDGGEWNHGKHGSGTVNVIE